MTDMEKVEKDFREYVARKAREIAFHERKNYSRGLGKIIRDWLGEHPEKSAELGFAGDPPKDEGCSGKPDGNT